MAADGNERVELCCRIDSVLTWRRPAEATARLERSELVAGHRAYAAFAAAHAIALHQTLPEERSRLRSVHADLQVRLSLGTIEFKIRWFHLVFT